MLDEILVLHTCANLRYDDPISHLMLDSCHANLRYDDPISHLMLDSCHANLRYDDSISYLMLVSCHAQFKHSVPIIVTWPHADMRLYFRGAISLS